LFKNSFCFSDSQQFTIADDPRGPTLQRGTQVSLHLKEEAYDFLEPDTLKKLIHKYSQFINFDILLWQSRTETVEEPIEEEKKDEDKAEEKTEEEKKKDEEDKAEEKKEDETVEDDKDKPKEDEKKEEEKPKTKSVERTVWDWEKMNAMKPIWMRKPNEVEEQEYKDFYKSITKDYDEHLVCYFLSLFFYEFLNCSHTYISRPKVKLASNLFYMFQKLWQMMHSKIMEKLRRILRFSFNLK